MRASPETSDQENLHQMPQGMVDAHGEAVVVRKYICPYACGKTYRNSNGLSYHLKKSRCAMTHQLALLATAAVPNTHDNDRKESTTNHHQPTPTPLSATTAQKRKKKMAPATAVDNNDDGPVTIMKKKPRTIAASTEDVTGVQRQRNTENGYLETPMSSAPPSSIRSVNVSLLSPPPPYPSTSAT